MQPSSSSLACSSHLLSKGEGYNREYVRRIRACSLCCMFVSHSSIAAVAVSSFRCFLSTPYSIVSLSIHRFLCLQRSWFRLSTRETVAFTGDLLHALADVVRWNTRPTCSNTHVGIARLSFPRMQHSGVNMRLQRKNPRTASPIVDAVRLLHGRVSRHSSRVARLYFRRKRKSHGKTGSRTLRFLPPSPHLALGKPRQRAYEDWNCWEVREFFRDHRP